MAKATVEMAFWDLWTKSPSLALQTLPGGTGDAIDVGVARGIRDTRHHQPRGGAAHFRRARIAPHK